MMKTKEMLDAVVKDLDEHKWKYTVKDFHDGVYAIDTDISSSSEVVKSFDIRFIFRKWDMECTYYMPVKAPEDRRDEVAAYLTRINRRIHFGKFDMDYDDGEIRYRLSESPYAVAGNVGEVLSDCLSMSVESCDRYVKGLMQVVLGVKSAASAFEAAGRDKPNGGPSRKRPPEPDEGPDGEPEPDASADEDPVPVPEAPQKRAKKSTRRGGGKRAEKSPTSAAKGAGPDSPEARYSLEGLNIQGKIPLAKVVEAVKRFRAGKKADVDMPRLNILLTGAPGSGKTAFVRYLAREVGAELRIVRASDLLSRYSGDTERRLAAVFDEAKEKGAILFLDEIDSFLRDRSDAARSWEVSQVNELLQQMEAFQGVMIGATNFADRLDKAVLRRFTYKLKLDYLTDAGKGIFFERYFKTPLTAEERTRLNAIANLTPGDFRTVREELFYLSDGETNAERLTALEAESEAKGRETKVGF